MKANLRQRKNCKRSVAKSQNGCNKVSQMEPLAGAARLPKWQPLLLSGFLTAGALVPWCITLPASAQVLYGTLTGTITDTSGAVVPQATVKAVETSTGVSHQGQTNAAGTYTFSDLNPGTYQITVTATGFTPRAQTGITVQTNTVDRVDVQLAIGSVSQTVQVTTAPPVLQTERSDTNYNISEKQLAELPTTSTTGRNFQSLYRLIPGSTPPTEQNSAGANPQRSQTVNVNGISDVTNTTRIDGAVDAYPWLPSIVAYLPPTDGIESVNVVTGSFNAEQGSAGGSAINVTIKSGTNQFHGSAWEYNSIAQFNAQNWQNRTGIRQKNIYNETGGSFGGPIIKDRLFFFADYDRVTVNKAVNGILSVPTLAMRSGDFTGTGVTIYDPATGDASGMGKSAFAGDMVPASRIAPAAATLLAKLPAPNIGAPGALANNYFGSGVNAFRRQNIDGKITYVPSQNTSFFGHYSASPSNISDPQVFGSNPGGGTFDGGQPGLATGLIQNVGLGLTHAFTTRFLVDANFGYTRQRLGAAAGDVALGDYGTSVLGIPGTNLSGNSLYAGIPAMDFTTYSSLGNSNTGNPFNFRDNQYTGNVNATYTRANHVFRFGGEYIHAAINHNQPGSGSYATPRGTFIFSGGVTAPYNGNETSANSFADFLLGQSSNYQKGVQTFNPETLRNSDFAFYGQDTWRATSKLVLNYGLRYEYYPLPVAAHFGTVRYDPTVRSTVTDTYGTHTVGTMLIGGEGGIPQHAYTSNGWGMVVPRFGVSYQADPKTVVRAGFGMTVDPDTLRDMLQAYPAAVTANATGANNYVAVTSLNPGLLSTTAQVGIPNLVLPSIASGLLPLPANIGTFTIPKDFRRGYIYSYNLSVQHEFSDRVVVNLGYVGTQAVRQQTSVDINAAPPGGGTAGELLNTTYGANTSNSAITSLMPFRGSNYNGLQAQVSRTSERRGATGLIYTYSKALDISDNSELSGLTFSYPGYFGRNWAPAGYDRTHDLQWWTTYPTPFGKGQPFLTHGVAGYVLGNWRLSTILSYVSGTPFTVTASSGLLNAPGSTQVADRNYSADPILNSDVNGARQYLNAAAFSDVSTAEGDTTPRFGTSGRNSVRGPGAFDLDASIKRDFPLWESVSLEVGAQSFDVTNTPQFANPASAIIYPTPALNIQNGFGQITTSNANRSLRLSGRIIF